MRLHRYCRIYLFFFLTQSIDILFCPMELRHAFAIVFLFISLCQCTDPPCRTNCSTDSTCWRAALTYQTFELVERLFSFSSLSVYVRTFQQDHSDELNDSISFIGTALENNLINQSIDNNSTINLFYETKQLLLDFCRNLTSTPVENIGQLPSLMCSLSTCTANTSNWMTLFIISLLIIVCALLIFTVQITVTYRHVKSTDKVLLRLPLLPASSTSIPNLDSDSYRF